MSMGPGPDEARGRAGGVIGVVAATLLRIGVGLDVGLFIVRGG